MLHHQPARPCADAISRHSRALALIACVAFSIPVLADNVVMSNGQPTPAWGALSLLSAGQIEGGEEAMQSTGAWEARVTAWRTLSAAELEADTWPQHAAGNGTPDDPGSGMLPGLRAGAVGRREGDLDRTFIHHADEPGVRRDGINVGNTTRDIAVGIAQRADGKVYLVGQAGRPGAPTRIAILRLTASNLDRDPRFGNGGLQVIELANPQLTLVKAVALMVDGYERFYILAQDKERYDNHDFALICLRTPTVLGDGDFEACPGFGSPAGVLVRYYDFGLAPGCAGHHDLANDIHLDRRPSQPMKLYLAGSAQRQFNACGDTDLAVIRTDLSGALDTSFAMTGKVAIGVTPVTGGGAWTATALAVTRHVSGDVVIGGAVGTGNDRRAILAMLNEDGTLRTTFCSPSVATCDSPMTHRSGVRAWNSDTVSTSVRSLVAAPNAGVYVARSFTRNVSETVGRLSRIDASGGCHVFCGEIDMFPEFSTHTAPVAMVYHDRNGLNGQITVANYSFPAGQPERARIIVYRFNETGVTNNLQSDVQFTTGPSTGRNNITVPGNVGEPRNTRPEVMAMDRQGRYLVAGWTAWEGEDLDFALARLQRDVIFINGVND